jgi:GNAT superfamily N-acetyltransferase
VSEKREVLIRPASSMDSVNVVRLIKAGWKETPAAQLNGVNEQQLLEYVMSTLRHSFAIVADLEGRLLGTLAVAPIRIPWCDSLVMAEAWICVVPQYRSKRVPEQLLDALDQFLDKNTLPVILGTQILTPPCFNEILAKRTGYEPSRSTFLRLPGAPAQAMSA